MDISLPDMLGFEATRTIRKLAPRAAILALTMHESEHYFFEMVSAGASGYVPKSAPVSQFRDAVKTVLDGGVWIPPELAQALQANAASAPPADTSPLGLGLALLGALVGGLILNLMPCVFPVLAMKAVSLSGLADKARGEVRKGAVFYTLGVTPAEPGYASARIAPRLGGLAWAKGSVTTPHGLIAVDVNAQQIPQADVDARRQGQRRTRCRA